MKIFCPLQVFFWAPVELHALTRQLKTSHWKPLNRNWKLIYLQ